MDEMQEIIDFFLVESREALQEVEPMLIAMEEGEDPDIDTIFRAFHSMKGSAGYLEFSHIERVTHCAEELLQQVRDGKRELCEELVDILCRVLDWIDGRLDVIEQSGSDGEGESEGEAELLDALEALRGAGEAAPAPAPVKAAPTPPETLPDAGPVPAEDLVGDFVTEAEEQLDRAEEAMLSIEEVDEPERVLDEAFRALHSLKGNSGYLGVSLLERHVHLHENLLQEVRSHPLPPVPEVVNAVLEGIDEMRKAVATVARGDEPALSLDSTRERVDGARDVAHQARTKTQLGHLLVEAQLVSPSSLDEAVQAQGRKLGEILVDRGEIDPVELDCVLEAQRERRKGKPAALPTPPKRKRNDTLRVDVGKLDALMDLVGELIIGVTAVLHHPDVDRLQSESFLKSTAQLSRITRGLQDVAMGLRMVPVAATFRKMIRLVRDVAKKQGKQVRLELFGEETEVDKRVAEIIADPLVHLLRNAVDHGMETPEERAALGKEGEGSVTLSALHQGGEIWIVVQDDGRGLDREKLHARAVSRGITARPLEELDDSEVYGFIFHPGFSTAEKVSDISGRGMGMDVVAKNVERVGGRIDVDTELGRGTTFTLRIPLTLAIIEGMLLRVGSSYFTIPLLNIKESVRVCATDITTLHNGQEMVRIREHLHPVLRLHDFYHLDSDYSSLDEGILVVVEDGADPVCLFVDELVGQRQTVVKGLSGFLGTMRGLSGCTVLGDGRISLILDIGLLTRCWQRGAA